MTRYTANCLFVMAAYGVSCGKWYHAVFFGYFAIVAFYFAWEEAL